MGVGVTVGVAFATLAVATAADMLAPLIGPMAGVFVWKGLFPLARRRRDVEVARRVESGIPGMHNRLVSCLDLAGRQGGVSPAFYRKLVSESLDRLGIYHPASAVELCGLRRAGLVALAGVALFGLLWLGLGDRQTTAVARVFRPREQRDGHGLGYFYYFHYYPIQAFYQYGGAHWNDWHPVVRDALLLKQNRDGRWDVPAGSAHADPSRIYSTAMACLVLDIYLHFLPAYQR